MFLLGIVRAITSAGVGVIVGNIIAHTAPVQVSIYTKVLTFVGEYALTHLLSDAAADMIVKKLSRKKKEEPKEEEK